MVRLSDSRITSFGLFTFDTAAAGAAESAEKHSSGYNVALQEDLITG